LIEDKKYGYIEMVFLFGLSSICGAIGIMILLQVVATKCGKKKKARPTIDNMLIA
jgi:hypothetical protein